MISKTCLMYPPPKEANTQFVAYQEQLYVLVSKSYGFDQSKALIKKMDGKQADTMYVSKWELFYVIPDNVSEQNPIKTEKTFTDSLFDDYEKMSWRYKSQFLLKIRQELQDTTYFNLLQKIYKEKPADADKLNVLVTFKNITGLELKICKQYIDDFYTSLN